jgi:hypothetical protein
MSDFYIGLITSAVVIAMVETLVLFEKKLLAAFTLAGIPFIYIGFSWGHVPSLMACVAAVAFFVVLAVLGYAKYYVLIPVGLILHGAWDLVFPHYSSSVPEGYDIFCFTIDIILGVYFFLRLRAAKSSGSVQ